ncbi:hypothetical protein C0Q70_04512 [Pomacea canaliculata]|uniref:Uncharacterized protein n=1 Tax=Pomacea canaliculata TaxID=400727 RepID=A0A2T7PIL6_POMCA|nr:hypothetical protein C0Q70_04512 [Pomacea canaliculata]
MYTRGSGWLQETRGQSPAPAPLLLSLTAQFRLCSRMRLEYSRNPRDHNRRSLCFFPLKKFLCGGKSKKGEGKGHERVRENVMHERGGCWCREGVGWDQGPSHCKTSSASLLIRCWGQKVGRTCTTVAVIAECKTSVYHRQLLTAFPLHSPPHTHHCSRFTTFSLLKTEHSREALGDSKAVVGTSNNEHRHISACSKS